MRIGIAFHCSDKAMSPVELAREAEARGFYSVYYPEHTHIPTSRLTPPPSGEAELPEQYLRSHDPYIALAAAASVTRAIRLGTGVALPAQHDPIALAKTIATLDLVSGGRLVLGIGYGWNREVMLAMQALWSQEQAEFRGEFVHFEPSWQWPKPLQQPRPRVLLGGAAGPTLFAHIAEFGDGWLPIGGAGMRASLEELRRAVAAAGRDPAALHLVPLGVFPSREKLDYYRSIGITEVALRVPSAPRDRVLPVMDDYAQYLAG
jgi:alkanesulfonate monooxygenase SsuD/methylene tetrahydromethanopterin reductase-like flavin-dependent oxidoreductase (luciferase family)